MNNSSNFEKYLDQKNYEVKTRYSGWGWFLFTFIGMSAKPTKVTFIDRVTGKIAAETSAPEILKRFVGR